MEVILTDSCKAQRILRTEGTFTIKNLSEEIAKKIISEEEIQIISSRKKILEEAIKKKLGIQEFKPKEWSTPQKGNIYIIWDTLLDQVDRELDLFLIHKVD